MQGAPQRVRLLRPPVCMRNGQAPVHVFFVLGGRLR